MPNPIYTKANHQTNIAKVPYNTMHPASGNTLARLQNGLARHTQNSQTPTTDTTTYHGRHAQDDYPKTLSIHTTPDIPYPPTIATEKLDGKTAERTEKKKNLHHNIQRTDTRNKAMHAKDTQLLKAAKEKLATNLWYITTKPDWRRVVTYPLLALLYLPIMLLPPIVDKIQDIRNEGLELQREITTLTDKLSIKK